MSDEISHEEAAGILRVSPGELAIMRGNNKGPSYSIVEGHVVYSRAAVDGYKMASDALQMQRKEGVDYGKLPERLPEKPTGYTKKMLIHLNYGGGKGAASFRCFDPDGRLMPFGYSYNTKDRISGLSLPEMPGVEPIELVTWDRLREVWPVWLRAARACCERF